MGKLIILRHGETEWNAQRRMTGQADVPLNGKGREQAKTAGDVLKGIVFDKIYVSPLERAQDTAKLLLEAAGGNHHLKDAAGIWMFETRHEIIERNVGTSTGLSLDDPRVIPMPKTFHSGPPGGESGKEVCGRVARLFDAEIRADLEDGKTVLIVAHAGVMRAIHYVMGHVTEETFVQGKVPNAIPEVYHYRKTEGAFLRGEIKDIASLKSADNMINQKRAGGPDF